MCAPYPQGNKMWVRNDTQMLTTEQIAEIDQNRVKGI